MHTHRRRLLQQAAACAASPLGAGLLGAGLAAPAIAAGWPSRPLKIVVPFAPGGSSDTIARLIAGPLGSLLGTTVVVENKTGANGNIGAAAVAQAGDEHTLLLSDMSSLAISPLVTKDLPYKPAELRGVTLLAYSPHLLVAHPSVPATGIAQLVAASRQKAMNVASSGSGSANHLGVVEIALKTGLKWQHVPFRGGAQALGDTAAGNTQLCLKGMLATLPLVQGGRLKLLGVSKRTRMALLPQAPTLAEQGVKDFESGTYQGVVVPASMPKAQAERLAAALTQVIRAPEVRARLTEAGAEVQTSSPAETAEFLQKEATRWANVIKQAGTQIEGNA